MLAKSFWCLMALPGWEPVGAPRCTCPPPFRTSLLCPCPLLGPQAGRRQAESLLPVTSLSGPPPKYAPASQGQPRLTYGLVDGLHAQVLHQRLPGGSLAWGSGLGGQR